LWHTAAGGGRSLSFDRHAGAEGRTNLFARTKSAVAPFRHFATAIGYVNEYAATGLDEYFAESVRAYVEVNDPRCAWLPVTRQDLYLRDPRMFALIERLFRTDFQAAERRRTTRYD
jgi:hypothetical protein